VTRRQLDLGEKLARTKQGSGGGYNEHALARLLDAVILRVPQQIVSAAVPFFLNFDIAFWPAKAQHLLDLAEKVETRRPQWLRNQVLVELFW
jgi:hypothetical protein